MLVISLVVLKTTKDTRKLHPADKNFKKLEFFIKDLVPVIVVIIIVIIIITIIINVIIMILLLLLLKLLLVLVLLMLLLFLEPDPWTSPYQREKSLSY